MSAVGSATLASKNDNLPFHERNASELFLCVSLTTPPLPPLPSRGARPSFLFWSVLGESDSKERGRFNVSFRATPHESLASSPFLLPLATENELCDTNFKEKETILLISI